MGSRDVRLVAVLRDSAGNPLLGRIVSFAYKRSADDTWTDAGEATTDGAGTASVTVTLAVPNTYDFRAYFAGDDMYESATAVVANYAVKGRAIITLTVEPL